MRVEREYKSWTGDGGGLADDRIDLGVDERGDKTVSY